jgi:hypothetical protein
MLNYSKNIVLKLYENAHIDLTTSEIVGYGVLLTGYIGNPIVRVHVVDAEEVQAIDTQPYVLHPLAGRC